MAWHPQATASGTTTAHERQTVIRSADAKCEREFAGSRAQFNRRKPPTSLLHDRKALERLEGADEDQTIARSAFHVQIEQPVHAVIQIDVSRARRVLPNKLARARPVRGVAGGIALDSISLSLHNDARAATPLEFHANELASHDENIARKESGIKKRHG